MNAAPTRPPPTRITPRPSIQRGPFVSMRTPRNGAPTAEIMNPTANAPAVSPRSQPNSLRIGGNKSENAARASTEMQAERHHLRLRRPLAIQHVEAVGHEPEVIVRGEEPAAAKLRVVGGEAVRHDEVRPLVHAHPVRELVVVRIRVVEEATLLRE